MQRTAEEFVHRLADGRWFVGDFLGTDEKGETVYLVELGRLAVAVELTTSAMKAVGTSRKASLAMPSRMSCFTRSAAMAVLRS